MRGSLEDPNTLKVNKNLHVVNNVLIPVFLPAGFFKEKSWLYPHKLISVKWEQGNYSFFYIPHILIYTIMYENQ